MQKARGNNCMNFFPKTKQPWITIQQADVTGHGARKPRSDRKGMDSKASQVIIKRHLCKQEHDEAVRIRIWDVRTLLRSGKSEEVKNAMMKTELDNVDASEARKRRAGSIRNVVLETQNKLDREKKILKKCWTMQMIRNVCFAIENRLAHTLIGSCTTSL